MILLVISKTLDMLMKTIYTVIGCDDVVDDDVIDEVFVDDGDDEGGHP